MNLKNSLKAYGLDVSGSLFDPLAGTAMKSWVI
jgi:hypothetical protein